MSSRRHERTFARRSTIQVLYTSEMQNESPHDLLEKGLLCLENGTPLSEYALMLLSGVEEHRDEIDAQLESTSENWTVARMPIVDRTILRLATYEMLYVDDVPVSVSINEAVELAKAFGGEDDSPRFVNGVLGRIAKHIESGDDAVSEAVSEGASEDDAADALPVRRAVDNDDILAEIPSDLLSEGAGKAEA